MEKTKLELFDHEHLEEWLVNVPFSWSQVIATRAALRVFPYVLDAPASMILATFRANFLSWVACKYLYINKDEVVPDLNGRGAIVPTSSSSSAYAYSSALSSFYTATSLSSTYSDAITACRFASTATNNATARSKIWLNLNADANWLRETRDAHDLIHQQLWFDEIEKNTKEIIPKWVLKRLDDFANSRVRQIKQWELILNWYKTLLPMQPNQKSYSFFEEKADLVIARQPDEFWRRGQVDKDVEVVLADIEKIVEGNFDETSFTKNSKEKNNSNQNIQHDERTDVKPKSDEPTHMDELGRRPFTESLVDKINEVCDAGQKDGFAVHLHAPWGAGKTSILLMMQDYMQSSAKTETKDNNWVVVNFNAWEHERRNPPWWPLIEAVERDCSAHLASSAGLRPESSKWIKKHDFLTHLANSFPRTCRHGLLLGRLAWKMSDGGICQKKWAWVKSFCKPFLFHPLTRWKVQKDRWYWWKFKADWLAFCLALFMVGLLTFLFFFDNGSNNLVSNLLKIFAGLAGALLTFIAATQSMVFGSKENANYYFQLSNDPLARIHNLFNKLIDGVDRPVCIFIDDLDRCHADFVVDLLEGIQSSFRHEKVTYVVAADKGWIRSSFETRYDTFKEHVGDAAQPIGYLFLEKIFQMSTPIPGMAAYVKQDYFDHLLEYKSSEEEVVDFSDDYNKKVETAQRSIEEALPDGITPEAVKTYLSNNLTAENVAAAVKLVDKSPEAEEQSKHLLSDFAPVLSGNPREMKRLLNAFAMRRALWILQVSTVSMEELFRWTIIEQSYPALADLLSDRPDLIKYFENRSNKEDSNGQIMPSELKPFLEIDAIYEIVNGLGKPSLTEEIIHDITKGDGNYS